MDSNTTTGKAYRLLVVALVVMIALQPVVGGAVAASNAPDDDGFVGDDCGRSFSEVFTDVLTGQLDKSSKCAAREYSANVSWADMYASALAQRDLREGSITQFENRIEDSRTVAKAKAKATAVEAFKNNSTRAETKALVNESINDYYTVFEKNIAETQNANANQAYYLFLSHVSYTSAPTGFDDSLHSIEVHSEVNITYAEADATGWQNLSDREWVTQVDNVTFSNGETGENVRIIHQYTTDGSVYRNSNFTNTDGLELAFYQASPAETDSLTSVKKANLSEVYDEARYYHAWNLTRNTRDDVLEQATGNPAGGKSYVDALYDTYDSPSDLNVTEVLDPITLAQEWNTERNSTGYYGWLAAEYGLTGLNGSVNSSFMIEYTPDSNHTRTQAISLNASRNTTYAFESGETYNLSGTMFTEWAPASTNGTWKVNSTYNTSNAPSGVVFIEQMDNGTRAVELDGAFEIVQLTNVQTGEFINQTTLDNQNYQTWDADSTREQMLSLSSYRNNILDSYDTSSGGGGGFDFGNVSPLGAGIGALVALGVVVVVGKEFAS